MACTHSTSHSRYDQERLPPTTPMNPYLKKNVQKMGHFLDNEALF